MEKDFNSDYLRGHIDTIILKTLFDGEKYGYEILSYIETKSNGSFVIKQPSLYSALKRLESAELISSRWQDSEIGGKRHYYSLTEKGKDYYEESKRDWNYSSGILQSLISDAPTETTKDESKDLANENTSSKVNMPEENFKQCGFFNNLEESDNTPETILSSMPSIEPEKEQFEDNITQNQEINNDTHEKNDAEFINETYVDDENDISFSNNVYLRIKNSISTPSKSSGEVDFVANETISPMNYFNPPKETQIVKTSAKVDLTNYSIKPYNKFNTSLKNVEFIKSNKLNFYLSFCLFLIMMVEIVGCYFLLKHNLKLVSYSNACFIISGVIATLPLIFNTSKFAINPYKKKSTRKRAHYVSILIWTFALIFITIMVNLVVDFDCFKKVYAFTTVGLPIILLSNLIVQEVLYNVMKKNRIFKA